MNNIERPRVVIVNKSRRKKWALLDYQIKNSEKGLEVFLESSKTYVIKVNYTNDNYVIL